MSERCCAMDAVANQCRCRSGLTSVQIRVGSVGSVAELPTHVVVWLCPKHFKLKPVIDRLSSGVLSAHAAPFPGARQ